LEVLAEELAKCVESVELVYTLEQFANALTGSKVKVISDLENVLRDNPEIDYDPDLFTQTVNELGYPQAVYWTGSFSGNSPLKVILDRFESDYARRSFLRIYVHKYRTLLGLPA
jgi:predicted KAP-like P-loop ATPase